MSSKRVTLKDVAAKAGVHQTTVSLAMRDHPRLPAATRERLQKLAREMGYRPDPMLSNLAAYRRITSDHPVLPTIGYIMDLKGESELQFTQARQLFLKAARERADELGYKLEVFRYSSGSRQSRHLDKVLLTRNITGLILGAFWEDKTDLELSWEHFSVIKIEMLPFNLRFDVVGNNQMHATRLAMEKVRQMGYHRVGMAVADHDEAHTRNLFSAGYFVGQTLFAPEDRVPILVFCGNNLNPDAREIARWATDNQVEVVISNWNELDDIFEQERQRSGYPKLVVHLDVDHFNSAKTGIVQNHEAVGRYAVERVTSLMSIHKRGMVDWPTMHLIDSFWREGEETGGRKAEVRGQRPEAGDQSGGGVAGGFKT